MVANFLAEIYDYVWPRMPNKELFTKLISLKRTFLMITLASEIDTLERFIYFTKHTEYIDHDVSLFFSEQILD